MSQLGSKFESLVKIIEKLRSPEGCPWDMEQTSKSLIPYFIEEIHEVIEAIDTKNSSALKEELGDVFLHVIFQVLIAEEKKEFMFQDVLNGVSKKLINRHPHVFGDDKVTESSQANQNWEKAKHKEKQRESRLDGVPLSLPSTLQAQRLQQKASYAGFDWKNSKDVWKKINEELHELKNAEKEGNTDHIENELGDLLFSIINLARFLDISADNALRSTNKKFKNRFYFIEKTLNESGKNIEDCSLKELNNIWKKAKTKE